MDDFLKELGTLLDWAQSTGELDEFSDKFNDLVQQYKTEEGVIDIANITAHNYNCHMHNRPKAIINTIAEWEAYNK